MHYPKTEYPSHCFPNRNSTEVVLCSRLLLYQAPGYRQLQASSR
jgi:hypothetical protein